MAKDIQQQVISIVIFQLGWFSCVVGGSTFALLTLPIWLVAHFYFIDLRQGEKYFIAIATIIGIFVDSLLIAWNVIQLPTGQIYCPPWLAILWLLFAISFNHALAWLKHYSRLIAIGFGIVGGPLSYYIGHQLNAIILSPLTTDLSILAIVWGTLMWLLSQLRDLIIDNGC